MGAEDTIYTSENDDAYLRARILEYMVGRKRLNLTAMIGDIISAHLEEAEEFVATEHEQVNHQHLVTEAIERMITEIIK